MKIEYYKKLDYVACEPDGLASEMKTREGKRIITKLKCKDFK